MRQKQLPMQGNESALLSRTPSSAWQEINGGPSSSSNTHTDYLTSLEDWRKQNEAKKAYAINMSHQAVRKYGMTNKTTSLATPELEAYAIKQR